MLSNRKLGLLNVIAMVMYLCRQAWLVFAGIVMAGLYLAGCPSTPAYAIDLPDSDPTVEEINAWRNVLETGDFFIIVYENTPYADTPDTPYSEAFVWRLVDTDGTTELAQALGANYNEYGYGYNVIGFYFSADDAPAGYWETTYYITLSGTASAFPTPPKYTFNMNVSDYSVLEDTDLVKADISQRILDLAADLNIKWGLLTDYLLLDETETGTKLSVYGQAFFRTAIYGLQAMAPDAFPFSITNISTDERDWDPSFIAELESLYTGTYLEDAEAAGEEFFNVEYNLMGMLIVALICAVIIGANWYLAGGNLWRGMVDSASPLVISSRMAMFGLGEVCLLAAVCWIYIFAKIWRVI